MPRIVTFLSDYGHRDEFVGVVHGVIARTAGDIRVIDLVHGIAPQDVRSGALALARALPFTPAGVHLAVVDPGVGGGRRAVAVRTRSERRLLVGPDNGLLTPALDVFGGADAAVEISRSPWCLESVSATFHGRDVFAPVAARLAAGAPLADAGTRLDPAELVRLELPVPRREADGALVVEVVSRDGYGNLILSASGPTAVPVGVGESAEVRAGGRLQRARCARAFSDVEPGGLLLYEDASGALALAVNGGDAGSRLGVGPGDELRLAAP